MRLDYAIPVRGFGRLADQSFVLLGVESASRTVPHVPIDLVVPLFVGLAAQYVEATPDAQHQLGVHVLDPSLQDAAPPMPAGFTINPGRPVSTGPGSVTKSGGMNVFALTLN